MIKLWYVMTSDKEQNAQRSAKYLVAGVDTESEAIQKCYELIRLHELKPMFRLDRYSTPAYTCAMQLVNAKAQRQ